MTEQMAAKLNGRTAAAESLSTFSFNLWHCRALADASSTVEAADASASSTAEAADASSISETALSAMATVEAALSALAECMEVVA